METIWLWESDTPTIYHDQTCKCSRHCQECHTDLDGQDGNAPRHPRARYCGDYCRGRAARERALDRLLQSRTAAV